MSAAFFEKAERRLRECPAEARGRMVFLVLSGSFNPIHADHELVLQLSRTELEGRGMFVVVGFLAPSTESYVGEKLGPAAWPLRDRLELCDLVAADSDWIEVWPTAQFSPWRICSSVHQQLLDLCQGSLQGCEVAGVVVMGSDTGVRILDKVAGEWRASHARPSYEARHVCCVVRGGDDGSRQARHLDEVLAPDLREAGITLAVVNAESAPTISSTAIRHALASGEWDALRRHRWLHPKVLDALEAALRT
jgi:nicotinic acid mononucleotide adenylyltransferase